MKYYILSVIIVIVVFIIYKLVSKKKKENFLTMPDLDSLFNKMKETAEKEKKNADEAVQLLQKKQDDDITNIFSDIKDKISEVQVYPKIDTSSISERLNQFKNYLNNNKKEMVFGDYEDILVPKKIPIIPIDKELQMDDCDEDSNGYFDLFKITYKNDNKLKDSIIFIHSDNCINSRNFFNNEFNKLINFFENNPLLREHISIPSSFNKKEVIDTSKYYVTCNAIIRKKNIQLQPIFYKSLLNNLVIDKKYTLPMIIYHKPPSPDDIYTYDIINNNGVKETVTQTYKDLYGENGYDPLNCEHLERNIVVYNDILSFYATKENLAVSDSTYKDEAQNKVVDSKIPILNWLLFKCWHNDNNPIRKKLYDFYINYI